MAETRLLSFIFWIAQLLGKISLISIQPISFSHKNKCALLGRNAFDHRDAQQIQDLRLQDGFFTTVR